MKRTLALVLVLVMAMSFCVSVFADDAEEPADSEFAILNQPTKIFVSPDAEKHAAHLGKDTLVKVVAVEDGKALIQWEYTCRFIDNIIDGEGWIDAVNLDMISVDELPNYMITYPDKIAWLGPPKPVSSPKKAAEESTEEPAPQPV